MKGLFILLCRYINVSVTSPVAVCVKCMALYASSCSWLVTCWEFFGRDPVILVVCEGFVFAALYKHLSLMFHVLRSKLKIDQFYFFKMKLC